ncbi:MAG: phytanoyl-CoA dioxygenase family protein, partial [Paracoccaceae bacterium]|nr:phytanoyl-CoA dioxygenase family protein [Paracoccaceae bacterium]
MDARTTSASRRGHVWLGEDAGDFESFKDTVTQVTQLPDWPFAEEVASSVLIYDGARVRQIAEAGTEVPELLAEWNTAFDEGPGVIVIKGGMPTLDTVDRATELFDRIILEEAEIGSGGGDHFAKPGANNRVWNAAQKHCLADPTNFAAYYSSDGIALAARAWLGRGYQLTAQVNRVNPGGAAQTPHRDYHLGFMNADQLATYP